VRDGNPEFGRLIRQARKRAGLTHDALADELSVGVRSVVRWERGIEIPTSVHQRRLVKVLDAPELRIVKRRINGPETARILETIRRLEDELVDLRDTVEDLRSKVRQIGSSGSQLALLIAIGVAVT
jgi:transcriptional regulator with XRE-family HTH domain